MVPNAPKWYRTHQNMSLGSNGVDRVRSLRNNLMQLRGMNFCTSLERFALSFVRQLNGPKCMQTVWNAPKHEFSLCHEVALEFFATDRPDTPHWTLNSRFGAFHTVCVHLGPLSCLTKLGAKRSELVQKFVRQCCVGVSHDERTRSTPLDPKLMFCCVSYHLGAFRTVWLPYETRCKTGWNGAINANVRATKSCRNFLQRTLPIHPIGNWTHVLVCFVLFGCIWDRFVALPNSVQNG